MENWNGALRQAMKERGVSQAELARRTDIPAQNINKYIQGHRTPTTGTLLRLTKALEITPDTLFIQTPVALDKDILYQVFLKALRETQELQTFPTLSAEKVKSLQNIVREFGGWETVLDFLTEEMHLRRLGEKEYQRIQREINLEIHREIKKSRPQRKLRPSLPSTPQRG